MNKFCQRVIAIGVVVTAIFSVLSYLRINSIVQMDYQDGYGNKKVLDNIDMNVVLIQRAIQNNTHYPLSMDSRLQSIDFLLHDISDKLSEIYFK